MIFSFQLYFDLKAVGGGEFSSLQEEQIVCFNRILCDIGAMQMAFLIRLPQAVAELEKKYFPFKDNPPGHEIGLFATKEIMSSPKLLQNFYKNKCQIAYPCKTHLWKHPSDLGGVI